MALVLSELIKETCCGALADKCKLVVEAERMEQYVLELETIIDGFVEEETTKRVKNDKD